MDNKSFVEKEAKKDQPQSTDEEFDEEEDVTLSGTDDRTLPISEEERLRQIERYKEMIKNLEASSPDRDDSPGDLYPSSSRSPLNAGASNSSLSNTISESPTMDLRSQRRTPRKDLPPDYGKNIVLLNSFKVGRKLHHVYLNEGRLIWEKERRGDSLKDIAIPDSKAPSSHHRQIVPLEDILCVRVPRKDTKHSEETATNSSGPNDEDEDRSTTFQLHYARHRTRNPNIWKNEVMKFHNSDPRIVSKWVNTLQDILAMQPHRPRHILMFVNPYGGKRLALNVYNKVAKPLFQLAEVDVSLVVTQRQNQVTDIIMNNYLEQYDGIVCCGGDGTFNELYNGLVRREIVQSGGSTEKRLMDLDLPRPSIPIGVIPGGSTNTISYCMNGTDDVKTAVLNIILGKTDGMDLSSVHRNDSSRELLRLYASVISYGFLGDVSKEAENYRSLGPKRYDYVGVKRFFKNTGYEAEIRVLMEDQPDNNNREAERSKCLENCERCSVAARARDHMDSPGLREELKELDRNESSDKWKVIRGKYFMICGANISCACVRSPQGMSPFSHIGDGCLDLILVKHSSFLNNLRLASRLSSSGDHIVSLYQLINGNKKINSNPSRSLFH